MPISAVDTISLAFQHTKEQLIRPFRLGQWIRLGLLGLATGELSSGGGCNFGNIPSGTGGGGHRAPSDQFLQNLPHFPDIGHIPVAQLAGLIALALLVLIAIVVALIYLNSVCRFILFESILNKRAVFEGSWRRWRPAGRRYFVWQILFQIVLMMGFVIVAGIPVGIAFAAGWLRDPKQHLLPLVLGGVLLFFVLMIFFFTALLIQVLAKDFVVPAMALEGLDWDEAWKRVLAMIKREKGGYAGYIGMKVVLAIAAGVLLTIVGVILILILMIPIIVIAVAIGVTAHVSWNVYTITVAVVCGIIVFAAVMMLMALISVPAVVFFPAYSIYFLAARYPALSARLYPLPPAPPSVAPPSPPPETPPVPPPLPLGPEPIG